MRLKSEDKNNELLPTTTKRERQRERFGKKRQSGGAIGGQND
jgi:hypothetical protein|tara:strand:+ start:358 stop:483 length:126 start_codon:yes stop_codon:yes gene_type:complete